jgi:hypothetical protein
MKSEVFPSSAILSPTETVENIEEAMNRLARCLPVRLGGNTVDLVESDMVKLSLDAGN